MIAASRRRRSQKKLETPAFPRPTRSVLLQHTHRQGGVSSEYYFTPQARPTQGANSEAAARAALEGPAAPDARGPQHPLRGGRPHARHRLRRDRRRPPVGASRRAGAGHRPARRAVQAAPALPRERPRAEPGLQRAGRRHVHRGPGTAAQRRGLPRRAGGTAHPRPHDRRRLLPPVQRRGAGADADGDDQRRAPEGLAAAGGGLLPAAGGDRRRRLDRAHLRRVQGGDGHQLRRAVGLPPAAGVAGQHQGAAVPGEPLGQPPQPRAGRRISGQGPGPVPAGGVRLGPAPRRQRLHADLEAGRVGRRRRRHLHLRGRRPQAHDRPGRRRCPSRPGKGWRGRRSTG